MRSARRQIALAVVLLAGAPAWCGPVTFDVRASQERYGAKETPTFTMTLSLAASAPTPVVVCPIEVGPIRVVRVTRDGVRVQPTRTVAKFVEPLAGAQAAALVPLAPGGSRSFDYHAFETSADGVSPDIEDVRAATRLTGDHKVLQYRLLRPGRYTIQFAYAYEGPGGDHRDVLRMRVESNVVGFRLD